MDSDVAEIMNARVAATADRSSESLRSIENSLIQGLGVVMTTLIQQSGGVADDAAQFAALNTASRVPASGAIPQQIAAG